MNGKDIAGKKCPQCGSFIKDGENKCSVCGSEFNGNATLISIEETSPVDWHSNKPQTVKCPSCGAINFTNYKFCKNCRFPLHSITSVNLSLQFNLRSISNNNDMVISVKLKPDLPFFEGYCQWNGFGFFVYKEDFKRNILIKRIKQSEFMLYKFNSTPQILPPGKEFIIGNIRFRILGDLNEGNPEGDVNSTPQNEHTIEEKTKTAITTPDNEVKNIYCTGKPRVQIVNFKKEKELAETDLKAVLGREFLINELQLPKDTSAFEDIADKHLELMFLKNGYWLANPIEDNFYFSEIEEQPVVLTDNSKIIIIDPNMQIKKGIIKIIEQKG